MSKNKNSVNGILNGENADFVIVTCEALHDLIIFAAFTSIDKI